MNRRYYFKVFKVIVSQQDQLSSPASSIARSSDGVTMDFWREDGMPASTSYLLQRLVPEVQWYQCIWNRQSSEYKLGHKKKLPWIQVARTLGIEGEIYIWFALFTFFLKGKNLLWANVGVLILVTCLTLCSSWFHLSGKKI